MHTPPRVLVVDDEKLVRWSLKETLTQDGYDVALAETGEEAVRVCGQVSFDLVVADLKMPGIDGIETVMQIKALRPGTKVVIITAHGSEEVCERARKCGAYRLLDKPFKGEEMREVVREVLASANSIANGCG